MEKMKAYILLACHISHILPCPFQNICKGIYNNIDTSTTRADVSRQYIYFRPHDFRLVSETQLQYLKDVVIPWIYNILTRITSHRYPVFSTRYSVMCNVYSEYHGTSEIVIISPYRRTNHALFLELGDYLSLQAESHALSFTYYRLRYVVVDGQFPQLDFCSILGPVVQNEIVSQGFVESSTHKIKYA